MLELSVIRDLVAIFGVIAGFSYYVLTVRNANRARRKDMLFQRINTLTPEWYKGWARNVIRNEWTTHIEYVEYTQENPDTYGFVSFTLMLFQTIGSMLKEGDIDPEVVFNIYSPNMIIWTWEKFLPIIERNREMVNYPDYYRNFEYLYNVARERYPNIKHRDEFGKALSEYRERHHTNT